MAQNDGGPAFPRQARAEQKFSGHAYTEYVSAHDGMSLRDWFAGQALAGMGCWMPNSGTGVLQHPETLWARSSWAYAQADAMLKAREDDA